MNDNFLTHRAPCCELYLRAHSDTFHVEDVNFADALVFERAERVNEASMGICSQNVVADSCC